MWQNWVKKGELWQIMAKYCKICQNAAKGQYGKMGQNKGKRRFHRKKKGTYVRHKFKL